MLAACLVQAAAGEPAGPRFASPAAPLEQRFTDPPAEARVIKIIHGWPDEPDQQDRWRSQLRRQGFGGVVCNVSFDRYLESEAHWTAFARAVAEAKKDGMALWLYDEKGYPSGNAGGLVLRDHPDWEAEGLLIADAECGQGSVTLELPPGKPILAAAYPTAGPDGVPLAASAVEAGRVALPLPEDGRLSWTAPAGRWQVMAITQAPLYAGTHAEMNLAEKVPYINLLRPEPTQRFLEVTHQRYAERFGTNLGRWFVATFTDEPSLMSMFFRRMPYRPLPWAPALPAEFQNRRGYALEPVLPDLVLRHPGPQAARHRHDFWLTIGELVSENFFGQIQRECQRLGLPSGGHLLAEEGMVNHVPLYGDFFRCIRRLDAPSIDCLTSVPADVPWYIARLVASAAELDGRRIVMCETSDHAQVWRPAGDNRPKRTVTEAEIRGTCNRLMVAGVNAITSYYSFTALDDEALRRLNAWVGRCATMLTGGHQVADVAVLYPVESVWPRFVPAAHWAAASPEANRIGGLFRTAGEALFEARHDFTVIDSKTLAEAGVDAGHLVLGASRWRVVVLPGVDTLPLAAWQNLERFVESGGVLVALGAKPANSDTAFPSGDVTELGRRLLGSGTAGAIVNCGRGTGVFLPSGTEALLPRLLDQALDSQVTLAPPTDTVRLTHRRVDGREVYFLIQDAGVPWEGEVTVNATGNGRLWDPATGSFQAVEDRAPMRVKLEAYGAAFLTFDRAGTPSSKHLASGSLSGLSLQPIPVGDPTESHGEFVRAVLEPDAGREGTVRAAWRARATLTRSNVDTFLFVRLPVTDAAPLGQADLIEVESSVPEGQRAPAQLLVILHEEGGADYLAETPRALGVGGVESTYIPISRFQLAGWSKDADGVLDRTRIREIRVGWGGYYGFEGERVEFGFSAPRFASTR